MPNEAFSRVKIDAQLRDQHWDVVNPNAVRFEYPLDDGPQTVGRVYAGVIESGASGKLCDRKALS